MDKCFADEMGEPAWKALLVWYQVSNQDKMIHPDTQREMSTRMSPKKVLELDASHASLASHSKAIVDLIKEAALSL